MSSKSIVIGHWWMNFSWATGAALLAVAPFPCTRASGEDSPLWSPDHSLYAVDLPGERVGKGQERERLVVFNHRGKKIAVAHVWQTEPDGIMRVGIRGCESWGWVDSTRLFCDGSINPSTGIYLVFDARSGRELHELIGTNFVWSPDHSRVANFGNVPHFSSAEEKSDSLDIDGTQVYPPANDGERHWYRSRITWSPDSLRVALVDHHLKQNAIYLVIVAATSAFTEHKLRWRVSEGDWPPDLNFKIRWSARQVIVQYGGTIETVAVNN